MPLLVRAAAGRDVTVPRRGQVLKRNTVGRIKPGLVPLYDHLRVLQVRGIRQWGFLGGGGRIDAAYAAYAGHGTRRYRDF